ncbi:MAG: hydrolase [Aureliella sp.]
MIESDLVELAELNSGSRNLAGLEDVASWLREKVQIPGASFESRSLPAVSELDDEGREVTYETGQALLWHCRPEAERRILLAIHYDTVFAVDHPFQRCRRLSTTQLQGPGVADAKGGVLVIREALAAAEQFGLARDLGWTILLNPDEEIGSPHSTALMQEIAPGYDFGLLFEPSLPSGDLVGQRGGSGNYTVVIQGKSAHVGRHFEDGLNAIARLSWLFTQLDAMNQREGLTVNVGFVCGGGPLNVVPDLAVGRFNVRVQSAGVAQWLDEQLVELYDSIRAMGYQVRADGGVTSPPKPVTPAMQSLMAAIEQSSDVVGCKKPGWVTTGGVCDGNKLAAAGLANIDSLGPIGGGLHSDQEWVDLPTISMKAKLIVSLLHRYSNRDFATN